MMYNRKRFEIYEIQNLSLSLSKILMNLCMIDDVQQEEIFS